MIRPTKPFGRIGVFALIGIVAGSASVSGWGCGGTSEKPGNPTSNNPATVLRVAAASDLQAIAPRLAEAWTRSGGTPPVVFTFGASGVLADQVEAGAPFDVFLSANRAFVERLARSGAVKPDSVRSYARGLLVMAVRPDLAGTPGTLADLKGGNVGRVALANPKTAPYGAAARQALERAGLWADLEPKLVYAESVRQALQFVEAGNADVGLVGHALAKTAKVTMVPIDPSGYEPLIQALGIVARTEQPDSAEAWARFLAGPEGRVVFDAAGFAAP